jgi:hypothetical protein
MFQKNVYWNETKAEGIESLVLLLLVTERNILVADTLFNWLNWFVKNRLESVEEFQK